MNIVCDIQLCDRTFCYAVSIDFLVIAVTRALKRSFGVGAVMRTRVKLQTFIYLWKKRILFRKHCFRNYFYFSDMIETSNTCLKIINDRGRGQKQLTWNPQTVYNLFQFCPWSHSWRGNDMHAERGREAITKWKKPLTGKQEPGHRVDSIIKSCLSSHNNAPRPVFSISSSSWRMRCFGWKLQLNEM